MAAPDGNQARAQGPALRAAAGGDQLSVVPAERRVAIRAGQAHRARRRRHARPCRRQAGAPVAAGAMGPLSPGGLRRRRRTASSPRSPSTPDSMARPAPTRPTSWSSRSSRRDYKSGDTMTASVTARTAGRLRATCSPTAWSRANRSTSRPAPPRPSSQSARIGAPAPMWSPPYAARSTRPPGACPAVLSA